MSSAVDLSRVLVTGGGKGTVVVNVSTGTETPLERPIEGEPSYSFSPDGALVAAAAGAIARVWLAKTGRVTYEQVP